MEDKNDIDEKHVDNWSSNVVMLKSYYTLQYFMEQHVTLSYQIITALRIVLMAAIQ